MRPAPSNRASSASGAKSESEIAPEARWQDIGDAVLQYLYYDGPGPAIVMLHATGFLPWMWHPLARALCGRYRVIAPYFCDHREVDLQHGGLSWMQLASDLTALCNALRLDRPLLVGHSMGAAVTAMAEATWGPRAAGMVLIEPIFMPEEFYRISITPETHPLASKAARRRNAWESEQEARAYLASKALFRNWDAEMLDLYIRYGMQAAEHGGLELTCAPPREAALFMGGTSLDPWPLLSRINCPTLLLEGQCSETAAFIDWRKAARAIPHSLHRVMPHAGHLIPMEQPDQTLSVILDFAASIGLG